MSRLDEVPASGPLIVTVNNIELGIYRVGSELVALRNACPHQAAPICKGRVSGTTLPSSVYEYRFGREGEILQCPWHGWEFDMKTGRHLVSQSRAAIRRYPLEVEGDNLYVQTAT